MVNTNELTERFARIQQALKEYISVVANDENYSWLFIQCSGIEIQGANLYAMPYLLDNSGGIYQVTISADNSSEKVNDQPVVFKITDLSPVLDEDGQQLWLNQVIDYIISNMGLTDAQRALLDREGRSWRPDGAETAQRMPQISAPRRPTPPKMNAVLLINSKISSVMVNHNELFGNILDTTGQISMVNVGVDSKKSIVAYIGLLYEGLDPRFKTKLAIKGYDRQLYDAVSTLYAAHAAARPGDPIIITPQEIWCCMTGITDKDKRRKGMTDAQLARLRESLDKFGNTRCELDLSQEIAAGYLKLPDNSSITSGRYSGRLLQFDKFAFSASNGAVMEGYRLLTPPIIYEYSAAKKQIITIDIDLFNTQDTVNTSEDVIAFCGYLARRIALMKNGTLKSRRINLGTIYQETGTATPEESIDKSNYATENAYSSGVRKRAKADRDKIEKILDSWISKGWISSYEEVKIGKSITGLDIYWENAADKLPEKSHQ